MPPQVVRLGSPEMATTRSPSPAPSSGSESSIPAVAKPRPVEVGRGPNRFRKKHLRTPILRPPRTSLPASRPRELRAHPSQSRPAPAPAPNLAGGERKDPCWNCVGAALAGTRSGRCMVPAGRGKRCEKCSKGHKCVVVPALVGRVWRRLRDLLEAPKPHSDHQKKMIAKYRGTLRTFREVDDLENGEETGEEEEDDDEEDEEDDD